MTHTPHAITSHHPRRGAVSNGFRPRPSGLAPCRALASGRRNPSLRSKSPVRCGRSRQRARPSSARSGWPGILDDARGRRRPRRPRPAAAWGCRESPAPVGAESGSIDNELRLMVFWCIWLISNRMFVYPKEVIIFQNVILNSLFKLMISSRITLFMGKISCNICMILDFLWLINRISHWIMNCPLIFLIKC